MRPDLRVVLVASVLALALPGCSVCDDPIAGTEWTSTDGESCPFDMDPACVYYPTLSFDTEGNWQWQPTDAGLDGVYTYECDDDTIVGLTSADGDPVFTAVYHADTLTLDFLEAGRTEPIVYELDSP